MQCTLDEIVTIAQVVSGIKVTDENRSKYRDFLQRQIDKHGYVLEDKTGLLEQRLQKYLGGNGNASRILNVLKNVPLAYMLADALAVFSYLIRETPVEDQTSEQATILCSDEDLHLMRVGSSIYDSPSETIYRIYSRRLDQTKAHPNLVGYIKIIDDIGKDPEVVRVWGRELSYDNDIKLSQHSNRRWGGNALPIEAKWTP